MLWSVVGHAQRDRAVGAALITGEPGSGKSRLLLEALQRTDSVPVVRAAGFEPMQSIALGAAAELLRQLATVPGHGAQIERLVFEPGDLPVGDPLRIFEATARALSAFGPLLLAIDDLQWFDDQSLGLIHYLLRASEQARQVLLVLAVARPSPAAAVLRASIDAAVPERRRAAIELGPLALPDGVALARALDSRLDDAGATALWRRAHGSPFWLESLVERGEPDTHANLVSGRLRALGVDAAELLAILAVGGRPFLVEDVARALGWDVERARYVSRELIARGLALEVAGSLKVGHDLIRESAVAALPGAVHRRLRGALSEVLETTAGDDARLLCEALEHRVAAQLPATALAMRLLASPRRRLLSAPNMRLLASVADLAESRTPEQTRLDAGVAALAAELGEHELALRHWARVSKVSSAPVEQQHASIAAARAAFVLTRADEAHAHLESARRVAPSTAAAAVRIDALDAEVQLWLDHETGGGARSAARAFSRAEKMATAAGGVEHLDLDSRLAFVAAGQAAIDAAMQESRHDDVVRLSETVMSAAQRLDEESQVVTATRVAFALGPSGRIREAEALYRRAWDLSRRLVLPSVTAEAGTELARALRNLGRLDEAKAIAVETVELQARIGSAPQRWGDAKSVLHTVELSIGDTGAALQALQRDADEEEDPHFRLGIHKALAVWQARFGGARLAGAVRAEIAAARRDAARARCPRCSAELALVSAELLARVGDIDDAERALATTEAGAAGGPLRTIGQSWAESMIAAARGDVRSASERLAALAMQLDGLGYRDEEVWARLELGRVQAQTDRGRAVDAFTAAASLAEQMGARSQGRLATQALRKLGVRAWRRRGATSGVGLGSLSHREREVVHLAADGHSNAEIAQALVLSPRTVERHLTNVLAKLSLRNRTELAALVGSSLVRGSPDE